MRGGPRLADSHLRGKSTQRIAKTCQWSSCDAGSDLTDAWLAMRDSRVDHGCCSALYNAPDVDAGRRASEAKTGQREIRVARKRDTPHLQCVAQRISGIAADEAHDRRCRCHREATNAGGLGNGAVAKV